MFEGKVKAKNPAGLERKLTENGWQYLKEGSEKDTYFKNSKGVFKVNEQAGKKLLYFYEKTPEGFAQNQAAIEEDAAELLSKALELDVELHKKRKFFTKGNLSAQVNYFLKMDPYLTVQGQKERALEELGRLGYAEKDLEKKGFNELARKGK